MLFFRAESLPDAFNKIATGFHICLHAGFVLDWIRIIDFDGMGGMEGALLMTIAILAVIVIDFMKYKGVPMAQRILRSKWRWVLYYAIVIVIYASLSIAN